MADNLHVLHPKASLRVHRWSEDSSGNWRIYSCRCWGSSWHICQQLLPNQWLSRPLPVSCQDWCWTIGRGSHLHWTYKHGSLAENNCIQQFVVNTNISYSTRENSLTLLYAFWKNKFSGSSKRTLLVFTNYFTLNMLLKLLYFDTWL